MKVIEITNTESIKDSIEILKANTKPLDIEKFKKEVDVYEHEIFDKVKRPDKIVKTDKGEKTENVARTGIALQKKIVTTTTAFSFGNPVELNCQPENETQKDILKAIIKVLDDNKIDSFNRRMCKDFLSCTQFAETWYTKELKESSNEYGFESKFKLRVLPISPFENNTLYPLFDMSNDMIAFSREFSFKETNSKTTQYFEIYTDEETLVYKKQEGSDWEIDSERSATNVIGKIPISLVFMDNTDYHDVQGLINRLETLLSNFADTNDYHGSPKIFVQGEVVGFAKKGETGALIQGSPGSTAQYLSWAHAPESVKLEIDTLFKLIYSLTQTVDTSFEAVKGLGDVSGIALELLFLDAHLKVLDMQEFFEPYLQRRINIIKAFLGTMNTAWKNEVKKLKIKPVIKPFSITDKKAIIDNLIAANGGEPIISQKTAITQSGMVEDGSAEFIQIQKEKREAAKLSIFPPSN